MKTTIRIRVPASWLWVSALIFTTGCGSDDTEREVRGAPSAHGTGGAGTAGAGTGGGAAAEDPVPSKPSVHAEKQSGIPDDGRCAPETSFFELIDDMEDADHHISFVLGRTGTWYAWYDESASPAAAMEPPLGGGFYMSTLDVTRSCVDTFSMLGMRSLGDGQDFAVTGFALNQQVGAGVAEAYQADQFSGVAFWARRGPDAVTTGLIVKLSDGSGASSLTPATLLPEWQFYKIPFTSIDPAQLVRVEYLVTNGGSYFDYAVDDVGFYRD
jgi:hypothetical protein